LPGRGVQCQQAFQLQADRRGCSLRRQDNRSCRCKVCKCASSGVLPFFQRRDDGNQFQEEFKAKFKNAEFGAGIRTLTGVVLWGNKATEDMGLSEKEDGKPVELLKFMKGVSAEILKFQLFCEQVGLITPYTNFITDKVTGDKTFIRYYPTLILSEDGNQPYFVALYITTPESDSQAGYYHFCDKLLSID
jgi:hypothetical protein